MRPSADGPTRSAALAFWPAAQPLLRAPDHRGPDELRHLTARLEHRYPRLARMRNGGRHCCQPPLRRAKDLPVFASLGPAPVKVWSPLLDPGSPAQASLPIRPLPRERSRTGLLDYVARRLAGLSPCPACLGPKPAAKTVRCSAALLGVTALASRFAHRSPEGPQEPRRARGRYLFRRLFPAGPGKNPKVLPNCLPAEIGPLVTCRAVLPLPAFWRGRDRRPDHPSNMRSSAESGKRKKCARACG